MVDKNYEEICAKYILLCIEVSFVFIIFIENFVCSAKYGMLSLRTIDDVAFQASLHKYHISKGADVLFMNDYGYGWIYWFPIFILTYPFHWLAESTSVVFPLLVTPRMLSLLYSILCAFLMYKIVSIYTEKQWIRMSSTLLLPLFPTGGYAAGRFGTISQVAFWSMLSFYLVIRKEKLSEKDLRIALLAFAVAMGTKVSAVCAVPLLSFAILNRYGWKFTRVNILLWIQEAFLAVVVMIGLMSPTVLLFLIFPEKGRDSWKVLESYWMRNNTGHGNIWENFVAAVQVTMPAWMIALLAVFLVGVTIKGISCRKEGVKYLDYMMFPIGYAVGMLYLCFTISSGSYYVFSYSTAISFVLSMGLLVLDEMNLKRFGHAMIVCICCIFVLLQMGSVVDKAEKQTEYNILAYFENRESWQSQADTLEKTKLAIEAAELDSIFTYIDYDGPIAVCNWYDQRNFEGTQTIWNDFGLADPDLINIIVLSKNAVGFFDDTEFDEYIQEMDATQRQQYVVDRTNRKKLLKQGIYGQDSWKKIYEDENVYVFGKL